jgi:hypothetical protein
MKSRAIGLFGFKNITPKRVWKNVAGVAYFDDMIGLGPKKPCSLTLEASGSAVTMRLCL